MAFLYLSWALDIKKAHALANWLAPKEGAPFSLIYFFDSFCIYYIPHNYVIPQAMPHAILQTHSSFYPQRGEPVVASPNVGCFLRLALFCFVLFLFSSNKTRMITSGSQSFFPMWDYPDSRIWKNFSFWNPESWASESEIQLNESGISLTIGIQNSSSTDKESGPWNPKSKTVLDLLA